MKFVSTRSIVLTCTAASLVAGVLTATALADDRSAPPARTETRTENRTENVRVQNVIVRESGDTDAVPGQSIFIKRREVTGEQPTTELTIIGEGGNPEIFNAGDLAVDETRSFQSAAGKTVEVTRTASGMILVVDGKSIELPDVSDLAGGSNVSVFSSDDAPSRHHEVRVVKVLSSSDSDAPGAAAGDHVMMLAGHGDLAAMDFSKLESLKNLSPEVREGVIAALKEIMATPHLMTVDVHGPAPTPHSR